MTQPSDETIRAAAQMFFDQSDEPMMTVVASLNGGRMVRVMRDMTIADVRTKEGFVAGDHHPLILVEMRDPIEWPSHGKYHNPAQPILKTRNKRIGGRLLSLKRRGRR